MKPWQRRQWCISELNAEFVYRMEDLLDLYEEPFDPKQPVVCFDEQPYQHICDCIESIPAQPGQSKRQDYTYQRQGICNFFMMFQPLGR